MKQCQTCGGVYATESPEGVPYYHACPPLHDAKTLTTAARPNARDEKVDPAKRAKLGPDAPLDQVMKAVGLGAVDV